jgi:hypothetical protein
MERGGNTIVNSIFEAKGVNDGSKPVASVDDAAKDCFVKDKYRDRKFYSPEGYDNVKEEVSNTAPYMSQVATPRISRQSSMPTIRSSIGNDGTGNLEKREASPELWKNMEEFAQWDAFDANTSPVKDELSTAWHPQSVDKLQGADNVKDSSKRTSEGKSRTSKSQRNLVKDELSISWHPQSVDKLKGADNVKDSSKRTSEGKSRTSKSQRNLVKDELSISWHPQSVDKLKDADNVKDSSKRTSEGKSRTSKSQRNLVKDELSISWHHPKRGIREEPRKRSTGFNDSISSPTDALNMTTETSKISLKKSPSTQHISKGRNHSASNEAPSNSSLEGASSHSLPKSGSSKDRRSHSRSRSSSRKRSASKHRKKKNVPSTPGPDLGDEKESPGLDAMEEAAKAALIGRLAGCLDGDAKDVGARLLELIDSVQKSKIADSEEAKTPRQRSGNSNALIQTGKSPLEVTRRDKSMVRKTPVQGTTSSLEIKRTTPRRAAGATVQLMRTPLHQTWIPDSKKINE